MILAVFPLMICAAVLGQDAQTVDLQPATMVGTVTDVNQDTVPNATVVLECPANNDPRSVVTNENGYFEFHDVEPGISYQVNITAVGFADWQSPALILRPGQFKILDDIQLRIKTEFTTVQVTYDPVEVATEQVKVQVQRKQTSVGSRSRFMITTSNQKMECRRNRTSRRHGASIGRAGLEPDERRRTM